ncbi:acyltransferase [Neiella marina]|uniref:Acyltransferase n=1 Tax=Neiella holothuriorum TaxID=2870530 RepID=A0ABS7EIZ8_9GAMM|nr:acyltransferase [Neiella holothuriorum]MBW8191632.1 acyltransferase [Neiella holothuriorum]
MKIVSIDYLKAIAVLYIVGYWHLFNYTEHYPGYYTLYTLMLAKTVLGLFALVSGFFISKSISRGTISGFYIKRVARIYPLYLLSVAVFWVAGLITSESALASTMSLSMFWGEAPMTLWFISMIMSFYLFAPALKWAGRSKLSYVAFGFAVITALIGIYELMPEGPAGVDFRVILYFPCFAAGFYLGRFKIQQHLAWSFAIGLAAVMLLSLLKGEFREYREVAFVLLSALATFGLVYRMESWLPDWKVVAWLSYASFAMYLFHRPLFSAAKALFFPEAAVHQLVYLVGVLSLLIVPASYLIQKLSDHVMRRLTATATSGG